MASETANFGDAPHVRKKVAILYGGKSAEHEISILSARYVLKALDRKRFAPWLIGITKEGRWIEQDESQLLAGPEDPKKIALQTGAAVNPLRLSSAHRMPTSLTRLDAAEGETHSTIDVVFPVLHGPHGEDGALQGLLEMANVPYVGAGVLGSAVGMDKDIMKRLLIEAGVPVAKFMAFRKFEFEKNPSAVCRKAACLGFPLFTKPANLGSSVGIRKVQSQKDLRAALAHAFEFDEKALAEEAVPLAPGGRELECAVLGGSDPKASIVGEIMVTSADGFYSYEAKYIDERGAQLAIPANIDKATAQRVQRLAVRTFEVLECHGLARVDFFLTSRGRLLVNEINTLPGFTAVSMYPKLWQASGLDGRELVTRLLDLAFERHARRARLRTSTLLPLP